MIVKRQLAGLDTGYHQQYRRGWCVFPVLGALIRVSFHAATAVLILALSTPLYAQSSVVADVKADLVAKGVPISGPCGAFQITKRVAWQLRGTGIGLLDKPTGNGCEGYSVDFLTYPDGSGLDILGDSGGANVPGWELLEPPGALTGRWRAPFDPGDVPIPGPIVPTPGTPPLDLTPITASLARIEAQLEQIDGKWEGRWKAVGTFAGKYIVPAVTAAWTAWKLKKGDAP